MKKWELENGIKNINKRKVLRSHNMVNYINNDNSDINGDSNNNNNNKNINDNKNNNSRDKHRQIRNICYNIVSKYILSFVKYNKHWSSIYNIGGSAGP